MANYKHNAMYDFKQQNVWLFLNDLFSNLLIKMTCYKNLFYNSFPHVTTLKSVYQ